MKKKILFGSLLAVILMLMIPNVSAVEYQTVVDANESYFIQEIQNRNLDIDLLKGKLRDMNIRELRETIQNINIDELKENILLDLENSDLTEQNKAYVNQLLDSELLLTILIRGIIIPTILYTIALGALGADNILPDLLEAILTIIIGIIVPVCFLLPILDMVEEQTGSFFIGSIVYWGLFLIDFILASIITSIIFPS